MVEILCRICYNITILMGNMYIFNTMHKLEFKALLCTLSLADNIYSEIPDIRRYLCGDRYNN